MAWNLLEAACIALRRLDDIDAGHPDHAFYSGKLKTARYFVHNVLPRVACMRDIVRRGDDSCVQAGSAEFGDAEGL